MSLFSKPTTYILHTFVFIQSTNIFSNTKMVMKVTTFITKLSTDFFYLIVTNKTLYAFLSVMSLIYSIQIIILFLCQRI